VLLGGRYVRYGSGQGDAGGEWQGGMQLSYALFDGGSRPAAQDRARAETRAAAAELAFGEQRVAESVDRAYAALISAAARRSALADAASQSEEVVRIERLALDAGAGVQTDYLAADAELLRVRAALTDARFAEVVATWSWRARWARCLSSGSSRMWRRGHEREAARHRRDHCRHHRAGGHRLVHAVA
jgi:outer membrane protein TolC